MANRQSKEVQKVIRRLKRNSESVFEIPDDLRKEQRIIEAERKLGIRVVEKCGYDIVLNKFYVYEILQACQKMRRDRSFFLDFDAYSTYLNGNIYDRANYYGIKAEQIPEPFRTNIMKIDRDISNGRPAITMDAFLKDKEEEEKQLYSGAERKRRLCEKWIGKIQNCKTSDELGKTLDDYLRTDYDRVKESEELFEYSYLLADWHDHSRLETLIQYLRDNKRRFRPMCERIQARYYSLLSRLKSLCLLYKPEVILDFAQTLEMSPNSLEHLSKFVTVLTKHYDKINRYAYFSKENHLYCEKLSFQEATLTLSFPNFNVFAEYKKNDLTNCNLIGAVKLNIDTSKYVIDETTILPIASLNELSWNISKVCKKINKRYVYIVRAKHEDKHGNTYSSYDWECELFFEFVAFLEGNLKCANLLECDGLIHLNSVNDINLEGAALPREVCEKFEIPRELYRVNQEKQTKFEKIVKNEKETSIISLTTNGLQPINNQFEDRIIFYFSDIHLDIRFAKGDKTRHEVEHAICREAQNLGNEIREQLREKQSRNKSFLLVAGDIIACGEHYELFLRMLRASLPKERIEIVVVIGNHDMWGSQEKKLEDTIAEYRAIAKKSGVYLLHNDILYVDSDEFVNLVPFDILEKKSEDEISRQLLDARLVILGGTGFAGYNNSFNANQGIYMDLVSRTEEIQETIKFEKLYKKVVASTKNSNLVVLTHMPREDWNRDKERQAKVIYVSGHTHKNVFYDDSVYRVYADNQIGYDARQAHIKWFWVETNYDIFANYEDGIYEIAANQYKDFCRGKNIQMNLNRKLPVIYMLKRNQYYAFFTRKKTGDLAILNGGAMKTVPGYDICYYYNKMEAVIRYINKPLERYTAIQRSITKQIRQIGGSGRIHGCIIDIDFYSHIFVNPLDLTTVGYFAENIINKVVYSSIESLLEEHCPHIYGNYLREFSRNTEKLTVSHGGKIAKNVVRERYLETDIYTMSRELYKMQKIKKGVLNVWYEPSSQELFGLELNDGDGAVQKVTT